MLTNVVIAWSAAKGKSLFQIPNSHKAYVDKHKVQVCHQYQICNQVIDRT